MFGLLKGARLNQIPREWLNYKAESIGLLRQRDRAAEDTYRARKIPQVAEDNPLLNQAASQIILLT